MRADLRARWHAVGPVAWSVAWTLRRDPEEQHHLERLCLDPLSSLGAEPAPVGTRPWWAALDAAAIPTEVREGRIVHGEGRPGDGEAFVVLREADGTETVHRAYPALRAAWTMAGRDARITAALHPAKPGRDPAVCPVTILFELGGHAAR